VGKLPGSSQAYLIGADNGRKYVVKFTNNPHCERILVNELVSAMLLNRLGLACPEIALVRLTSEFLRLNPNVSIQGRSSAERPPCGIHFGSCLPGSPNHDFVSRSVSDNVLKGLTNLCEFAGVLVFDKWISNQDHRQCIFEFNRPSRVRALWIDNGHVMGGPRWKFEDSPRHGLYAQHAVYEQARTWADFEPWLEGIRAMPEGFLEYVLREVPNDWVRDDHKELRRVIDRLMIRRQSVADLIQGTIESQPSAFPNWKRLRQTRKS
jgi:hypothetical protein